MPDMRRTTSRGGDSTVHLLNFAVADSTYANKDSRDSMNCSLRDSNLSSGEPKRKTWPMVYKRKVFIAYQGVGRE